jgi:hypothetical protein
MQQLEEGGPEGGSNDSEATFGLKLPKKARLAALVPIPESKAPVAAIPSQTKYDVDETSTFGNPIRHERNYGRRFSPMVYSEGVRDMVRNVDMIISLQRFFLPISYHFLFMNLSVQVLESTEPEVCRSQLSLSNVIFDDWVERYEIAHVILWVSVYSCIRFGFSALLVRNPLPLVQSVLKSISRNYNFEFTECTGSDTVTNMHMDIEAMTVFLAAVQAHISLDTLAESYPIVTGDNVMLFHSTILKKELQDNAAVVNSGYLVNFGYFLLKLHHSILSRTSAFTRFTDVARVQVYIECDSKPRKESDLNMTGHVDSDSKPESDKPESEKQYMAVINSLDVRPCAQRLQFARILLWRLIRSCVAERFSRIIVNTAYRYTASLCVSLGFSRIKVERDDQESEYDPSDHANYEIRLDAMEKLILPAQCGINEIKLKENPRYAEFFELNQDAFPTFQQLNCQADVDARFSS